MHLTLKIILKWLAWGTFVSVILFYAFYQSRNLRAGPTVTLETPTHGESFTSPLIHVRGKATQAKELNLNGRGIFVDLEGRFDEQLLLQPGYNIIELTAKDAGGRETRKTLELTLIESPPASIESVASGTQSSSSTYKGSN